MTKRIRDNNKIFNLTSIGPELDSPNTVEFSFGLDNENYLWIRTIDTYGSFSQRKLYEVLSRACRNKTAIIDMDGGAGLGIFMLYSWATSLVFSFDSKKRTEVFVKLKVCRRRLHFDREAASIHTLESP